MFWNLPLELRNMIHELVWQGKRVSTGLLEASKDETSPSDGPHKASLANHSRLDGVAIHLSDLAVSKEFCQEVRYWLLEHGTVVFNDPTVDRVHIDRALWNGKFDQALQHIRSIEVSAGSLFYSSLLWSLKLPNLQRIKVTDCDAWRLGVAVRMRRSMGTSDFNEDCGSLQRFRNLGDCLFIRQLQRHTKLRYIKLAIPPCENCEDVFRACPDSEVEATCHLSGTLALSMEAYVLSSVLGNVRVEISAERKQVCQLNEEIGARTQIVTHIVGEVIAYDDQDEINSMAETLWPTSWEG